MCPHSPHTHVRAARKSQYRDSTLLNMYITVTKRCWTRRAAPLLYVYPYWHCICVLMCLLIPEVQARPGSLLGLILLAPPVGPASSSPVQS